MPRSLSVVLFALLAATLWSASVAAPVVWAQEADKEAAAQTILLAANAHYEAGRFDKAAAMYTTAFEVSRNPAYLFNAGRAWQRAYALDKAEGLLRRYLELEKRDDRGIRRATLHLQEIAAARKALAEAEARGEKKGQAEGDGDKGGGDKGPGIAPGDGRGVASPGPARAIWMRRAGWGLSGLGAISAIAGAWLLASALDDRATLDEALADKNADGKIQGLSYTDYRPREDDINDRVVRADLLIGAGVIAAGAGLTLLWAAPDMPAVTAAVGSGGASLGMTWRF